MAVFTLEGYSGLIRSLLERGYVCKNFHDVDVAQQHLILRHDVDMSLEYAARVARVEADLGVASTFFVLVRSELYNPASAQSLKFIQEIIGLGHEIGLHLDASLYDNSVEGLTDAAEWECALLQQCTGAPVKAISFHRPAKALLGWNGTLAGRVQTYHPKFFEEMGYCSDSRGEWAYGTPDQNPAVREGRSLQLLTHPIWWCETPDGSAEEKVQTFILNAFENFQDQVTQNCTAYRMNVLSQIAAVRREGTAVHDTSRLDANLRDE